MPVRVRHPGHLTKIVALVAGGADHGPGDRRQQAAAVVGVDICSRQFIHLLRDQLQTVTGERAHLPQLIGVTYRITHRVAALGLRLIERIGPGANYPFVVVSEGPDLAARVGETSQPLAGVVAERGYVAVAIGDAGGVIKGVVGQARHLVEAVGDLDNPVARIKGVAGDRSVRIRHPRQVVIRVVEIGVGIPALVRDKRDAVAGVVAAADLGAVRTGGIGHPAQRIVGEGRGRCVGVRAGGERSVRVVGEHYHPTERVGDGQDLAAIIVGQAPDLTFPINAREHVASGVVGETLDRAVGISHLSDIVECDTAYDARRVAERGESIVGIGEGGRPAAGGVVANARGGSHPARNDGALAVGIRADAGGPTNFVRIRSELPAGGMGIDTSQAQRIGDRGGVAAVSQ